MSPDTLPPPGTLTGQVVLITGGTRGIGKAIALRLARERPRQLVLAYNSDHDAARASVAELRALGVEAAALSTDLGQPEEIERLFATIGSRWGRLDVFISNAARAAFRPVEEMSLRSWQRTMDINARAFLQGGQLAARLMGEGGGRIIGLSSLGSQSWAPGYVALGAAKAALESMARYMAVELAPRNIHVNVVCGGFIDTPSMRLHPDYERMRERVQARTPTGRLGQPEDLAGIVAFLCGPDSRWLCGQTLVADGGFSLVP